MALAATDFSLVKRRGVAPGTWVITGKYTGPASYASGGEILTNAILKSALGINKIDSAIFSPFIDASGNAGVGLVFDHVSTSTTQGKIRAINAGNTAHLHSFLVKGGTAAAGTDTVNIKSLVIGKEEVTDRTNLGGTGGGVQNSTAVAGGSEVAAATNLSSYSSRFVIYGA